MQDENDRRLVGIVVAVGLDGVLKVALPKQAVGGLRYAGLGVMVLEPVVVAVVEHGVGCDEVAAEGFRLAAVVVVFVVVAADSLVAVAVVPK